MDEAYYDKLVRALFYSYSRQQGGLPDAVCEVGESPTLWPALIRFLREENYEPKIFLAAQMLAAHADAETVREYIYDIRYASHLRETLVQLHARNMHDLVHTILREMHKMAFASLSGSQRQNIDVVLVKSGVMYDPPAYDIIEWRLAAGPALQQGEELLQPQVAKQLTLTHEMWENLWDDKRILRMKALLLLAEQAELSPPLAQWTAQRNRITTRLAELLPTLHSKWDAERAQELQVLVEAAFGPV